MSSKVTPKQQKIAARKKREEAEIKAHGYSGVDPKVTSACKCTACGAIVAGGACCACNAGFCCTIMGGRRRRRRTRRKKRKKKTRRRKKRKKTRRKKKRKRRRSPRMTKKIQNFLVNF